MTSNNYLYRKESFLKIADICEYSDIDDVFVVYSLVDAYISDKDTREHVLGMLKNWYLTPDQYEELSEFLSGLELNDY